MAGRMKGTPMAALPYMQLYVADYLADTAHLSAAEHGAYLLLIMNYWQRGKPLPAADDRLARICRMTAGEWDAVRDNVREFFTERDGLLYHKRVEEELAAVMDKSDQARNAGRISAAKRRLNDCSTSVITDVQRTFNHADADAHADAHADAEPNTSAATSNSKPLPLHDQAYIPMFAQIAALFGEADLSPSHNRIDVLKKAVKNVSIGGFDRILEAANNLARSPAPDGMKRYDWLLHRFDYAEHITEYLTAKNNARPRPRKYAEVPDDWRPDASATTTA
jgi:uncharacterized protein YdaU (DUF1376 family)